MSRVDQSKYVKWLVEIFDHEVREPEWWWEDEFDEDFVEMTELEELDFLAEVWTNPEPLLGEYSANQIGQGMYYLANNACSNYACALNDFSLPQTSKLKAIDGIANLYERCFAKLCSPALGHCSEEHSETKNINGVCYMFWDVLPFSPHLDKEHWDLYDEIDDPELRALIDHAKKTTEILTTKQRAQVEELENHALASMEKSLAIDHPACQEGALHGLGHWSTVHPDEAKRIIITAMPRLADSRLVEYAKAACDGNIL